MTQIWQLLTGVVIFMLGATYLEDGVKALVGRSFKIFLRKQTSHKARAVVGGAIVTSVLQSSSVVNLMILAFVGAGVIMMDSALAIMLGANLGTTISNWVVATLGFKFNIETIAYPLAGISGMVMLLSGRDGKLFQWSRLLFGFAFLFVGLAFIKTGMQEMIQSVDLSGLNHQPAIVFLGIGLVLTAIIQSSSATVAIVLSALYVDAISLFSATAVVLGAEIGTTLKLLLASAKGTVVKKRVAYGNVIFNTLNVLVLFALLVPANYLITDVIGMKDKLLALVLFQSLLNIVGILIFFPLLGRFAKFLDARFAKDQDETLFIHKVKPGDAEPALVALDQETRFMLYHTAAFTLSAFDRKGRTPEGIRLSQTFTGKKMMEQYEYIKHLHGEIYQYAISIQRQVSDPDITNHVYQLIDAARNIMYAAKNIKDAAQDIEQLKKSSKDLKYDYYMETADRLRDFFDRIIQLVGEKNIENPLNEITAVYQSMQKDYHEMLQGFREKNLEEKLTEVEFSTVLNFNREIFTCEKSIAFAVKDLILSEDDAAKFDDLPGFIR